MHWNLPPTSLTRSACCCARSGSTAKTAIRSSGAIIRRLVMALTQGYRRIKGLCDRRSHSLRHEADSEPSAAIGHERQKRAHYDPDAAEPDPFHERIQEGVDDGKIRVGIHARKDDVNVFAKRGVDGNHGAGGLFRALELALLWIQHHELLVVFQNFDDHALRGVIRFGLGVGTLQDQCVWAQLHGFADIHRTLHIGIERGTRETDEDENHTKVHNVAAVAAGVAHRQFVRAHHHAHPGARGDDFRAAVELHYDGPEDEAAKSQADDGESVVIAHEICSNAAKQPDDQRPAEI